MTELTAHPVADLFPMLAADELAELAADIKTRGLLQPIVLDAQGRVLDGRNRLAACEQAGIEPTFETYTGDDPDGYAFVVNVNRRHLRAGARHLLTEQARRLVGFTKLQTDAETARLSEAAMVLDFTPDYVDDVMRGRMSLQTALATARQRKKEKQASAIKENRIRAAAPDLLDFVADGRLDLDEALAALDAREEKARQEAERVQREAEAKAEEERREAEARASEEERTRRVAEQERQESLERDRDRIRAVINGWTSVQLVMREPETDRVRDIVADLMPGDQKELQAIIDEVNGAGK